MGDCPYRGQAESQGHFSGGMGHSPVSMGQSQSHMGQSSSDMCISPSGGHGPPHCLGPNYPPMQ